MSGIEKQCVLCGQSCAGQPRIKNGQGQYAHQACVKAKQSEAAAAPAANTAGIGPADDHSLGLDDGLENGLGDGLGGGLDADLLLGDMPSEPDDAAVGGLRQACPGCGNSLDGGTVVCMSCGFDTRSGKAMKTKVGKMKEPKSGVAGVAAGAGSFAVAGTTFLVGAIVGSAVGGAVGAAVWAGIAIGTGWTIGYIGLGVGILAGFGAAIGSRGQTGTVTGLIAALITMIAVPAGHYVAVKTVMDGYIADIQAGQLDTDNLFSSMSRNDRYEHFGQIAADQIVAARLTTTEYGSERYEELVSLLDFGLFPDDYPADVVVEARGMFDERSVDQQAAFVDEHLKSQRSVGYRMEQADMIISERLDSGGLDEATRSRYEELLDFGVYPHMYPQDIIAEADGSWDALSVAEQDAYVDEQAAMAESLYGDIMQAERQDAYASGFMGSIGIKMIITFILAIGIAYGVGSGGGID